MKRRIFMSLLTASLGLTAIAAAHGFREGDDYARAQADSFSIGTRPAEFSISGQLSGLFPGQRTPLVLAVANPYRFAIEVTSISAGVQSRTYGCSADNLVVKRFRGTLTIPGQGSRRLKLKAALLPSAPAVCQGATFPLSYRGRAVRP